MARREHRSRETQGPSQRQLRVGEELRHALARILGQRELRDPALHDADITVTEVRISPDLKNATAFVMPLGGVRANEIIAALQRGAAFLRRRLAREVPMRFTPSLRFALDTSFDHASRIEAILHRPEVERDLEAGESEGPEGAEDGA
ncbi:MAG: 30S ribosome-binding factor RbfA [Alphaproteobacteria bacterium]|nr:30S ribosome-binding factor RbfA [Alphaproteobacteria bacterium]